MSWVNGAEESGVNTTFPDEVIQLPTLQEATVHTLASIIYSSGISRLSNGWKEI